MSSYFFCSAEKNQHNAALIDNLVDYAENNKELIYVLDKPLTDQRYDYDYKNALILLIPKCKVTIINYGPSGADYDNFLEDVIEDLGSISDKYLYKEIIGRPRTWRSALIESEISYNDIFEIDALLDQIKLRDAAENKKVELLISLFIGSINDVDRVKETVPVTNLDKVKQKIQLFDGDQTRFVYQKLAKKRIIIQGLSGTGKTELLLHKLKDLYIIDSNSRIFFTCHNKILADSLRNRIPTFFNFMKVEQQIEWNSRLWCVNAWGSSSNPNSGAYRFICAFYGIPFNPYSYTMSFSLACKIAVSNLKERFPKGVPNSALDYMFIDESQDFDENFFELCELVTKENIYVAGDIFQSIFDEKISSSIDPDFLLGKCYRTDPKTLMFAHALGMGLFDDQKLRWLEKKEWKDCGYNVSIDKDAYFHLSREPIRRFEDLTDDFDSIELVPITSTESLSDSVLTILQKIIKENPTVGPDDVGIIFLDQSKAIYDYANALSSKVQRKLEWNINKAYESKEKITDTLLISNRNNVKGLEFPFVICITLRISNSSSYRNSLYTMLTRSFIKSYFVIPNSATSGLTRKMQEGLKTILETQTMIIKEPSESEKDKIRTRFKSNSRSKPHFDVMMDIFNELKIGKNYYDKLLNMSQQLDISDVDYETLREFVKLNYRYLDENYEDS